ncbi:MAG: winged helix-turn-helix transcriptional regulator [Candidatus Bathyarchaeia archaeon]
MDEIDKRILDILRRNARSSYTAISKELNLSEGTIRKRVKNLVESGVIRRFTIETSVIGVRALVLISTATSTPTSKVAEEIAAIRGVESVFEVTGEFDVTALIHGDRVADVNRTIDDIRGVQGVSITRTLFVLRSWL